MLICRRDLTIQVLIPSTISRVTDAEGGTCIWLLWAMQEMTVLASLGCSPVIMRTLVTSEPTLTVFIKSDNIRREEAALEVHK